MKTITAYDNPALNSAITKSWKRLVPLMFILYFIAFIDRVNGIRQRGDAGGYWALNSAFALGAGIFFRRLRAVCIPANLILNKIGAQKWLTSPPRCGRSLPSPDWCRRKPSLLFCAFYWG